MHLYLVQSSQKRLAENFFLITTVRPWMRHWPTPMMLPEKRGSRSQLRLFWVVGRIPGDRHDPSATEEEEAYLRSGRAGGSCRRCPPGAFCRRSSRRQRCDNTWKNTAQAKDTRQVKIQGFLWEKHGEREGPPQVLTCCAPRWQPWASPWCPKCRCKRAGLEERGEASAGCSQLPEKTPREKAF